MPQVQPPRVFQLGDQRFREIRRTTMRHDGYLMQLVQASGLGALQGATEDEAVLAIARAQVSGHLFTVLGCLLIDEGLRDDQWTPDDAERTAERIGDLDDPDAKDEVRRLVLELLLPFLISGKRSSGASRSSSGRPEVRDGSSLIDGRGDRSDTGPMPSATLPETILSAPSALPTGLSTGPSAPFSISDSGRLSASGS